MSKASRTLAVICCILLVQACQSPFLVFPGGALEGAVRTTADFGFASEHRLLQLEVNPAAPYSVILRITVIDDALYIDAAPTRQWGQQLAADPRVRVRIGQYIYPAVAVLETDPAITGRFLAGRTVYRLMPAGQD